MIEDRPPLEAAGGVGGRMVDHNGIQAPLLSLERQIFMEEEVTTPPREGRPAAEPQGLPPRGGGSPGSEPQGSPRGPSTG